MHGFDASHAHQAIGALQCVCLNSGYRSCCHMCREMKNVTPYFAYGSNLHPQRLESRIGQCGQGSSAILRRARLTFGKRGIDGSGKCNIEFTEDHSDIVVGVVYEVSEHQRTLLDKWEATTCGYKAVEASVERDGDRLTAFTFVAGTEHIDTSLLPFHWYKRFVVKGALHFGFPQEYVAQLERHPSVADSNPDRVRDHVRLLSEIEEAGNIVDRGDR